MENFDIYKKLNNENSKQKPLSKELREEFERELNLINRLIEENLDVSETESVESSELSNESESEDNSLNLPNNEPIQSYNDAAKLQRERLQRIGILKNDQTGKNFKASGEDI